MSQKELDLRVVRTRALLKQSLLELCKQIGFKAATVEDIAKQAKINRVTFYRHYRDKYDLALAVFGDAVEDLNKAMAPVRHSYEELRDLGPPRSLTLFFEHIAANSRLYALLIGSDGDPWFVARMREYLASFVEQRIISREQLGFESLHSGMTRDVVVNLVAATMGGIISWWLENGMKYPPAQMAEWLQNILLNGYLGKPSK